MKRKGILSLILLVTLTAALLTGCGKADGSSSTADAPQTAAPEATAAPAAQESQPPVAETEEAPTSEQVYEPGGYPVSLPLAPELTEFSVLSGDLPFLWQFTDEVGYSNSLNFATVTEATNVKMNISFFANAEALQINIASGDYYDAYWNFAEYYTGGLSKAFEDGVILDLMPYTDKMDNYMSYISQSDLDYNMCVNSAGQMLAIYSYTTQPTLQATNIVREDFLAELGLTVDDVVTYDDYHDYLTRIKTELGVEVPVYMFSNGTTCQHNLAAGWDANGELAPDTINLPWQQEDGTVKMSAVQPGYRDYLDMLRQWYSEGLFNSDFLSHTNFRRFDDEAGLFSGKYGLWFSAWTFDRDQNNGRAVDESFDLAVLPDAVQKSGDTLLLSEWYYTNIIGTWNTVISTACENPELICLWHEYTFSDEGALAINYGKEGVSYTMTEDGPEYMFDEYFLNNELIPAENFSNVFDICLSVPSCLFMADRQYFSFSEESVAAYDRVLSNTVTSDIRDSHDIPNTLTVKPEHSEAYSNICSEISTFANEWVPKYIMGEVNEADWDIYVSTITDMGLDEITGYMQEAYDDFWK